MQGAFGKTQQRARAHVQVAARDAHDEPPAGEVGSREHAPEARADTAKAAGLGTAEQAEPRRLEVRDTRAAKGRSLRRSVVPYRGSTAHPARARTPEPHAEGASSDTYDARHETRSVSLGAEQEVEQGEREAAWPKVAAPATLLLLPFNIRLKRFLQSAIGSALHLAGERALRQQSNN